LPTLQRGGAWAQNPGLRFFTRIEKIECLAIGLGSARGPRPEIDSGAAAPNATICAITAHPVDYLSFGHNTLAALPPVLAVTSPKRSCITPH